MSNIETATLIIDSFRAMPGPSTSSTRLSPFSTGKVWKRNADHFWRNSRCGETSGPIPRSTGHEVVTLSLALYPRRTHRARRVRGDKRLIYTPWQPGIQDTAPA